MPNRLTVEHVLARSRELFDVKWDFSRARYTNRDSILKLGCPIHKRWFVLLVIELDQNSDLLAMQARSTLLAARTSEPLQIAANTGGVTEAILKSDSGGSLKPLEQRHVGVQLSLQLYNYAAIFREVENGSLAESDIPIRQWATVMQRPTIKRYWEQARKDHSPGFVEYIEQQVLTHEL